MAKFVVVQKAPDKLEKGEVVIGPTDFLEQICSNSRKAPKHKQTSIHHMREILNSIAEKYDHGFNPLRVPLTKYEGIAYNSDKELNDVIVKILKNEYPIIFDKVLEDKAKNRPFNTKLIYYVGDFTSTSPLFKVGLDHIEEKDIDTYMTGKPKKIVGKPAVTKEEAEVLSNDK